MKLQHTTSIGLVWLAFSLAGRAEINFMNDEQKKIDQLLVEQLEFFKNSWLGDEISSQKMIEESDARWAFYMEMVKGELNKKGFGDRPDLIAGKEKVREFWGRRRAVLLLSLSDSVCKLHRFNGGKNEPCGYIVMRDGKPFRWLTVRINRPDPSVGNVELPFP